MSLVAHCILVCNSSSFEVVAKICLRTLIMKSKGKALCCIYVKVSDFYRHLSEIKLLAFSYDSIKTKENILHHSILEDFWCVVQ